MAIGGQAFFRIARQNSGGTATSATGSFHSVPFVRETLVTDIPDLVSDTIRQRYSDGPVVQGLVTARGDVEFRPHPIQSAVFAYAVTGVISSTAQTSGQTWQHIFVPPTVVFDPSLSVVPWTIEVNKGVGNSHQYSDALCSVLVVQLPTAQYLRGTATFLARTSSLMAATTPTFPTGNEYTWNQASVSLDSTALTAWEDLTLTFDNKLNFFPTLDNTVVSKKILRTGFQELRVSGTADLPDLTEFNRFRAGSMSQLIVNVAGNTISSGNIETFQITIPTFRYSTFPVPVHGPGRLTVGFTGRAVYNVGSAALYQILCVNTLSNF